MARLTTLQAHPILQQCGSPNRSGEHKSVPMDAKEAKFWALRYTQFHVRNASAAPKRMAHWAKYAVFHKAEWIAQIEPVACLEAERFAKSWGINQQNDLSPIQNPNAQNLRGILNADDGMEYTHEYTTCFRVHRQDCRELLERLAHSIRCVPKESCGWADMQEKTWAAPLGHFHRRQHQKWPWAGPSCARHPPPPSHRPSIVHCRPLAQQKWPPSRQLPVCSVGSEWVGCNLPVACLWGWMPTEAAPVSVAFGPMNRGHRACRGLPVVGGEFAVPMGSWKA